MNKVVESYAKVPDQLDEGWMVHVAQKFLLNQINTLFGPTHQHLQHRMEGAINRWVVDMHYPYAGKAYIVSGENGAKIATAFLVFLRQEVCKGNESKANELYYRISADLIMHYPDTEFDHLDFIIAIDKLCKGDKNQSIQIVQNSLDGDGTYINIERLWQLMKDLPRPSLKAIFRL